jgi:Flp pilus assembly protein TadD
MALVGLTVFASPALAGRPAQTTLTLEAVDQEPAAGRRVPSAQRLATMAKSVSQRPKDRAARFALVRGLMAAGQMDAALQAARAWRQVDAYNLVVVRLLGDIHAARGERAQALRVWSAVVELLSKEPSAQRALASALKQAGEIEAACDRLQAAVRLRADDQRLAFELADCLWRIGRHDQARSRFEAIVANPKSRSLIRHPARQRLARIHSAARLQALKRGDTQKARQWGEAITALKLHGGTDNHIKVYLTWDIDRSDVDLWVTNPKGEKVFYSHRKGRFGGELFGDVTDGYGPESFTASRAAPGVYTVQVHYFGTSRNGLKEARGEVAILLHEGSAKERRVVLPWRLYRQGQVVTVARIRVEGEAGGRP